jgi:twitching motility protein PilI
MPIQRTDLRAYQESIAARLAAAQAGAAVPALLGFESGGHNWLIDLTAAGEVLPLPAFSPVPLTQPWFIGLANVRGELEGIVDFSVFCGDAPTPCGKAARLLRIGARSGANTALLVARVHGLKRADALQAETVEEPSGGWRGAVFADAQGVRWRRLDPAQLLADPGFIDAALQPAGART